MKLMKITPLAFVLITSIAAAASSDNACGTLVGGAGTAQPGGSFQLRAGERVDFVRGGGAVHGILHVFADGNLYRAYWQPDGSPELYVLANAGDDSVRLIATPTQGQPVENGQPGTSMPPMHVLSCPTL